MWKCARVVVDAGLCITGIVDSSRLTGVQSPEHRHGILSPRAQQVIYFSRHSKIVNIPFSYLNYPLLPLQGPLFWVQCFVFHSSLQISSIQISLVYIVSIRVMFYRFRVFIWANNASIPWVEAIIAMKSLFIPPNQCDHSRHWRYFARPIYTSTRVCDVFFYPVNVTYFLDLALLSLLLAAVVSSDRRRNSTEHKPQGNLVSGDWVE